MKFFRPSWLLPRLIDPDKYRLAGILLKRASFDHFLIRILSTRTYFSLVYRFNYWADSSSRSGPGSSSHQTQLIRENLPRLIETYQFRSILDAPCGDFQWMGDVVASTNVNVIAIDIVPTLISHNIQKYHNLSSVTFQCADLTTLVFPNSDLWVCRDLFFHLSFEDIRSTLKQFVDSEVEFMLVTNHCQSLNPDLSENIDIKSGSFRLLDLALPPFGFPAPLESIIDSVPPQPPRSMNLYRRTQILELINNWWACD